ncbi:MAG TPA: MBL fold metallo-hydrolase [bacterium]|nr:MBL fold metallo-hydrolase [bacterium]
MMNKKATLTYFGRSSVKVVSAAGFTVYFDPYAPGDYSMPADLVLVTHGHGDHNAVNLVSLKPEGLILAPSGAVSGHTFQAIHEGSVVQVGPVSVRAVAAYNKNHDRASCVGYVVDLGGIVVYHAGDTSYIPEMASLAGYGIDYALLPTDGFYNMDGAEAARCAHAVRTRVAVAIHSSRDQLYSAANAATLVYAHALAPEPGEIFEM